MKIRSINTIAQQVSLKNTKNLKAAANNQKNNSVDFISKNYADGIKALNFTSRVERMREKQASKLYKINETADIQYDIGCDILNKGEAIRNEAIKKAHTAYDIYNYSSEVLRYAFEAEAEAGRYIMEKKNIDIHAPNKKGGIKDAMGALFEPAKFKLTTKGETTKEFLYQKTSSGEKMLVITEMYKDNFRRQYFFKDGYLLSYEEGYSKESPVLHMNFDASGICDCSLYADHFAGGIMRAKEHFEFCAAQLKAYSTNVVFQEGCEPKAREIYTYGFDGQLSSYRNNRATKLHYDKDDKNKEPYSGIEEYTYYGPSLTAYYKEERNDKGDLNKDMYNFSNGSVTQYCNEISHKNIPFLFYRTYMYAKDQLHCYRGFQGVKNSKDFKLVETVTRDENGNLQLNDFSSCV